MFAVQVDRAMELTPLTPELRQRFRVRKRAQMLPKLRLGLAAWSVLFVAFVLWDWLVLPEVIPHTLPLRVAFSVAFLGLLALTYLPVLARWPSILLQIGVVAGTVGVTLIGQSLDSVHVFGTSALMLVIVVVSALTPSKASAILSFVLALLTSNVSMWLQGAPWVSMGAVSLFVISASLVAGTLAVLSERIDLRAFQLEMTLERLATTDALSGTLNRGAFFEAAARELDRAQRHGLPVSLFILDIDHFKRVNDTFGHPAGDAAIRAVADALRRMLRSSDLLARIGGEEFAILAAHTDEEQAWQLAERLRREVAQTEILNPHGERMKVTVSVGTATWAGPDESLEQLLVRADTALYAAKHGGRNRVVVAAHAA